MLSSRANEIPELVHRLGSRKPTVVDSARARLSIIGARAVEDMIEALEGDDNRVRARVMPLLALIQDPRGRAPMIAMLLDESTRLREIAARSLGRFPARDTVMALKRLLKNERDRRVRTAAVQALIELYASGREDAVAPVLERVTDVEERSSVRIAALGLLRHLKPAQQRSIVKRFLEDPNDAVRARATELLEPRDTEPTAIDAVVEDLAAEDYAIWNRAVRRLAGFGAAAIDPLVTAMQSRAHDPEFCVRAGMALKAMGPRRGRRLVEALETVDEPLPLQVLVEAIGAMGEKPSIYRLKDLIERLAESSESLEAHGFDTIQRVRAKAHLELARVGSRVAIQDLREAMRDPDKRVELEMLGALELVGNREEIAVLLRAWAREDEFMRQRIADVVRAIMKRERIRRNNRMFQTLGDDERRILEAILPPPARRKRRPPPSTRRPPRSARPD
jgi:HEAT repeat protein